MLRSAPAPTLARGRRILVRPRRCVSSQPPGPCGNGFPRTAAVMGGEAAGMAAETRRLAGLILSGGAGGEEEGPAEMERRRLALSRAITLTESRAERHARQAELLLGHLLLQGGDTDAGTGCVGGCVGSGSDSGGGIAGPRTFRVGIAGPPGAGKSTFIEALGLHILEARGGDECSPDGAGSIGAPPSPAPFVPSKVAVIAIDPSSSVTGGSVLGDKTRMTELSRHPRAFVRPSPTRGTLGGLATYTSDVTALCEAAGYDLVLVETVGLGQSEIEVCEGVDLLLLLLPPGGGDGLQGAKKGIVEMADLLAVNKADGPLLQAARQTAADYDSALGLMGLLRSGSSCGGSGGGGWDIPPVLLASAATGDGIGEIWSEMLRFRDLAVQSGGLADKRRGQGRYWMFRHMRDLVLERVRQNPALRRRAEAMEAELDLGRVTPRVAAAELVESLAGSGLDRRGRDGTT